MKIVMAIGTGALALASSMGGLAHGSGPSDAEIAAIVVVANQVDIDAGKLAAERGHAQAVRAFGTRMATDHAGVNAQAAALVQKLGVTPQPNDTSRSLATDGAANVASLRQKAGAAFDRAYVAHEIAYHAQVLDALDKTLVPSAHNADLKALLVKVRPAFVAHLEHARMLQGQLGQ